MSNWLGRGRGLAATVLIVALVAAASPADEILHDLVFRHVVSHEERLLANGLTLLGATEIAGAGLVGLAIVARWSSDAILWHASAGGVTGILLAGLGTQVVKSVACRARPRLVDGWGVGSATPPEVPERRGFFHWPCATDGRYQSFPSGHAATAFAAAAALSAWAPSRRRGWLLAAAAGVGISRVVLNAHFLSDVLAGGVIGWWSGAAGLALVRRHIVPRWPFRRAAAEAPGAPTA